RRRGRSMERTRRLTGLEGHAPAAWEARSVRDTSGRRPSARRALRTTSLLLAACAFFAASARPADAGRPPGVVAKNGDKLTAQIDAGDSDAFAVDLAVGGSLALKLTAKTPLLPRLSVFAPDGSDATTSAHVSGTGKRALKVKKLAPLAGQTGTWRA